MAKVKLGDYFGPVDLEHRVQRAFKYKDKWLASILTYVTARAIMDRFDGACTPFGWQLELKAVPEMGGFLCGISVWDDGKKQWITKWDGADTTDIESFKGGISGSIKRAAVHWGVGRYLYELEPELAEIREQKPPNTRKADIHQFKDKASGFKGYWASPRLPDRFLPAGVKFE